ncbi:MAG: type II secretion system protein M [Gammaproteobacteria bacterium]|uniref:type II secretion system protein GspM n=1 Tax=Rhodoferax sp. TaxID=50421 RepID=UPI001800D631|nr:type II secretion system protein GspM [Rhodoferax sp.]MBU3900472.1 type II secretion system protein M [Gammaproteobacteria bacterium]MBA3059939.1 type II secretion system protein M [Rhodoferax sp.]MBU3997124.1 type II secretion system protein M [Gammaproteobacteria bacterium]MBU4079917.1 type II secretion system protein M [Gammaproteobacteria bacterium]MBU4112932.1 type II secretion system protein M [Gammaproteobacteria bacterium]
MKLLTELQARWRLVARREQRLLLGALALVLVALLWGVALAPALATLKAAQQQRVLLDAQWQQMLRLQAQAQALQAQPPLSFDDARRLLEASVKSLGSTAQLSVAGERVTLSAKGISADALAQWLAQARLTARAVPSEVRLVRAAAPAGGAPAGWHGTLVLSLSAR